LVAALVQADGRCAEEARIGDDLGDGARSKNREVADLVGRIVEREEGIEFGRDLANFHVPTLLDPQFSMKDNSVSVLTLFVTPSSLGASRVSAIRL
jgi:hypothetical protein